MSLIPFVDPFDYTLRVGRPSRILDQCFGLGLDPEDMLAPLVAQNIRDILHAPSAGYLRPWRTNASHGDVGSTVSLTGDHFEANLDVQQFKPEEISVKVNDRTVIIEGKHEEKQDKHGFISRQFVRKYLLPKDCDMNKLESKLSSDGVLTIVAPKTELDKSNEKNVQIIQTGKPSKTEAVEQKK